MVVGAGIAGLVTACRASELGLKVVVLEQGIDNDYLCNSRITGGVLSFASENMMDPPQSLIDKVVRITSGFVEQEMLATLANDARRALEWCQAQNIKFVKISPAANHSWVFAPIRLIRPGLDSRGWRGRGGDALLRLLGETIRKRGCEIHLSTKVRKLIFDDGRCVGVEASHTNNGDEKPIRYLAKAVVLADGGFQADNELVRRFISKQPEKVKRRNAGTGTGDAVRMLEEAGAKLVGMKYFYGHLLSRDAMENDSLWPYPVLDSIATAAIVVNGRGERFLDEGLGGVYLANGVSWSDDPHDSWVIFDEDIWNGPGKVAGISIGPNPSLIQSGGTVYKANSLAELERQAGFASGAITSTVASYNQAIQTNAVGSLHPTRTTHSYSAKPIVKPPFYAVPMCAGLTFTMGGGAVDTDMRVLREDGSAISGLFAAGKSAGGLEGGETVGCIGGLSLGLITGLRAAEAIKKGAY